MAFTVSVQQFPTFLDSRSLSQTFDKLTPLLSFYFYFFIHISKGTRVLFALFFFNYDLLDIRNMNTDATKINFY